MATKTLGTAATTTLTAVQFSSGLGLSDADIATIALAILNDNSPNGLYTPTVLPGAFARSGLLYYPNRGLLRVLPGDFVGVDPSGWPVLVGKDSIATTATATGDTHTTVTVDNLSSNVLTLGWVAGMVISSSNADITAGTKIKSIAKDGLSLVLTAAATGTNAGGTLTVGSWVHS